MSLKKGNEYFKNGKYELALQEYEKIESTHPLYDEVQFNIEYIQSLFVVQVENNPTLNIKEVTTKVKVNNLDNIEQPKPLLSIVMPVFNVAPYLDACLLSVRGQTYKNFELIVVDDASTDNAKEIIEMHAALDTRIRLISLPYNTLGGAGIPSNIGMNMAKGEYIGFVDSDDWVDMNAFGALIDAAVAHDADLVIADFCTFDENNREIKAAYDKEAWLNVPRNQPLTVKEYPQILQFSPVPWRKLYKTSFVKQHQVFYPEGDFFFEDNPLHWQSVTNAKNIVVIDHLMSFHRMAREGQTMSSGAFRFSALFDHMNYIRMNIPKNDMNIQMLKEFIYKTRWIINRQKDEYVQNLFKKRLSQEYYKCKGKETNQSEVNAIKKFSVAFPETALTVLVYAESEGSQLDATLRSIEQLKDIEVNTLVVFKEIEEERLTELNSKHQNLLHFSFNRGVGRGLNSLQAICSGDYALFMQAGNLVNPEILSKVILEAKNKKVDIILCDQEVNSNHIIINRGFMHFYNIFFGPTEYSFTSFYWLSYIYAKKVLKVNESFIDTKFVDQNNIEITDLMYELDNMATKIKLKEVNQKNLSEFINYFSEILTKFELNLSSSEWENFKKIELSFMSKLVNVEKSK